MPKPVQPHAGRKPTDTGSSIYPLIESGLAGFQRGSGLGGFPRTPLLGDSVNRGHQPPRYKRIEVRQGMADGTISVVVGPGKGRVWVLS